MSSSSWETNPTHSSPSHSSSSVPSSVAASVPVALPINSIWIQARNFSYKLFFLYGVDRAALDHGIDLLEVVKVKPVFRRIKRIATKKPEDVPVSTPESAKSVSHLMPECDHGARYICTQAMYMPDPVPCTVPWTSMLFF